jgi:hypothetical protein
MIAYRKKEARSREPEASTSKIGRVKKQDSDKKTTSSIATADLNN